MGNSFCHFHVQSLSIIKSLQSAHLMQHSLLTVINTVHYDGRDHWRRRSRVDKVHQCCLSNSIRSICQGGDVRKRTVVLTLYVSDHTAVSVSTYQETVSSPFSYILYQCECSLSIIMENCFLWLLCIYSSSPFFFYTLVINLHVWSSFPISNGCFVSSKFSGGGTCQKTVGNPNNLLLSVFSSSCVCWHLQKAPVR